MPSMIVRITLQLGALSLAEAGLSFLWVGINPRHVADGQRYLLTQP
jgi:ABC-type dipeptide/oligopeptide/nickel transport system permease subunit